METIQHILELNTAIRPLGDQIAITAKVAATVAMSIIKAKRAK